MLPSRSGPDGDSDGDPNGEGETLLLETSRPRRRLTSDADGGDAPWPSSSSSSSESSDPDPWFSPRRLLPPHLAWLSPRWAGYLWPHASALLLLCCASAGALALAERAPYVDSLFVCVSAVTETGLATLDVPSLGGAGQAVLLALTLVSRKPALFFFSSPFFEIRNRT